MSWPRFDRSTIPHHVRAALLGLTAMVVGLAACSSNVADPDLWGHIQYGREVIQHAQLPRTATWTYVAEGAPWVNHEIIAELLLAFSFDQFGTAGLISMKAAIGILMFGAMIYAARRSGAGWFVTCVITAIAGANIQFHWHYRPQILSYLSLAVMLLIWQLIFRSESATEFFRNPVSMRRLNLFWFVVPLMIFWTNSHGGFAAGLAIICAYHGVLTLQVLQTEGLASIRSLIRLWGITGAVVLASLINPYGLEHWKFMLDALTLPRPEISDWQPLSLWDRDAIRFWSLLGLTFVGCLSGFRGVAARSTSAASTCHEVPWRAVLWRTLSAGQNLPQWTVFLLLLWQGMSHCRHMAIVAIVFGFWMPRHLQSAVDRILLAMSKSRENHSSDSCDQDGACFARFRGLACLCLIAICLIRIGLTSSDIVVDRTEFPVSAMQFVSDHRLQGKMLVTFNWAQYAIGCFGAPDSRLSQSRVAVDGRFETCYPREITDVCFDFWLGTDDPRQRFRSPQAPPFDPTAALTLNQPDLVLISRLQRPSVRIMEQQSQHWVLLYQDSLAQLWGQRSGSLQPSVSNAEQSGGVAFPGLPQHQESARLRLTAESSTHR